MKQIENVSFLVKIQSFVGPIFIFYSQSNVESQPLLKQKGDAHLRKMLGSPLVVKICPFRDLFGAPKTGGGFGVALTLTLERGAFVLTSSLASFGNDELAQI